MSVDWGEIFGLSVSPLEIVVRGTAMYWFLFLLFRVVIRRRVGAVGISDILLLVIIADASQNALSGDYKSVTDGFILVATILGWNMLVDWLTYMSTTLQRLLEPPPLLLVDRGKVLRRHLRLEFVNEDELRAKLREHGITDYAEVEKAYMESDGEVSVIKRNRSG
ncbi:MAG TPA: YetF domain-containing protein [Burkholderiales bacterium]|nr:YetF domain-containing protein [Burkholderiales bacterium]